MENTVWFVTRKKTAAMAQTSSHQTLVFSLRRENIRKITATSAVTTTICAADFNSDVFPNIDFEKKFGIPFTSVTVAFGDTQKAVLEKSFVGMVSLFLSLFPALFLPLTPPFCPLCVPYYHAGSLLSLYPNSPQCVSKKEKSGGVPSLDCASFLALLPLLISRFTIICCQWRFGFLPS